LSSGAAPRHGYEVAPHELATQVTALTTLGDETNGLVASAGRLAERLPQLGTAPPALHLAMRLREAAGQSGLTGEVSAANTELNSFHRALNATVNGYLEHESDAMRRVESAGEATT
jgi:hypothetical protein